MPKKRELDMIDVGEEWSSSALYRRVRAEVVADQIRTNTPTNPMTIKQAIVTEHPVLEIDDRGERPQRNRLERVSRNMSEVSITLRVPSVHVT